MSLFPYQEVSVTDVLCYLAAKSSGASALGAQLDTARSCYDGTPLCAAFSTANEMHVRQPLHDVVAAQSRAEATVANNISLLKCVDGLAQVRVSRVLKDREALSKLQRQIPERGQGELVVQILRVYQEFSTWPFGQKSETKDEAKIEKDIGAAARRSESYALAALYEWASSRAPLAYPVASDLEEGEALADGFRFGRAKKCRQRASELYADAFLVLADWVTNWNLRRQGIDVLGHKRRKGSLPT